MPFDDNGYLEQINRIRAAQPRRTIRARAAAAMRWMVVRVTEAEVVTIAVVAPGWLILLHLLTR